MCLERSIQKCVYITKLENKLIYIYIDIGSLQVDFRVEQCSIR